VILALPLVIGISIWLLRRRHPTPPGLVLDRQGVDWSLAKALARIEARRFLRHPAILFGALVTPLAFWGSAANALRWWELNLALALAMVPFGWVAILAGADLQLWSRRTGNAELFSTTPSAASSRAAGLIGGALALAPLAALYLVAGSVWMASRTELIGSPSALEQAAGVFLVVGGAVLGITGSALAPRLSVAGPALLIVAVTVIEFTIAELPKWPWRWLAFLVPISGHIDPVLESRPAALHLGWLAALTVLAATVALARWSPARAAAPLVVTSVVVLALVGGAQVATVSRAPVEPRARLVSNASNPVSCATRGRAEYCPTPSYRNVVSDWQAIVEGVLRRTPITARPRVAQRPEPITDGPECQGQDYLDGLDPRVAGTVRPGDVWPEDRDLHPGFGWPEQMPCGGAPLGGLGLAVQAASWAVGLPPTVSAEWSPCVAPGQARSAAALWLATSALPKGDMRRARLFDGTELERQDSAFARAGNSPWIEVQRWPSLSAWGVRWHDEDFRAARALSALPPEQVESALRADWQRWLDPETPANELLRVAGADPTTIRSHPASGPWPVCP
jgi:hypothetical protein